MDKDLSLKQSPSSILTSPSYTTVAIGCQSCWAHNSVTEEALAILGGLKHALTFSWNSILLQSDAQAVVHYINGVHQTPWHLQANIKQLLTTFNSFISIVTDINKQLLTTFNSFTINYILRNLNSKAHQLALFDRTLRSAYMVLKLLKLSKFHGLFLLDIFACKILAEMTIYLTVHSCDIDKPVA
ncbi:hypothetical protein C4D60_Mb06t31840 [Musa balbisiana]|uniref:RNase H type-1 domain-containing protein n=1 Tax=Musa balbisiana TaxID=52838 RepID=A0A4S8ITG1_MUSBA|nr:hypothetical protein C4D60_Mb06t31840 [Musa balbisiana]